MIVVTVVAALSASAATKQVSRAECSFQFDYPDSWSVAENPEAGVLDPEEYRHLARCAVGLRPRGWTREIRDSPLHLKPYPV
ncbi:MAG: hypothetical protein ACLGH0_15745, partial [Thermoanaerobaculia bacterium]